MLETLTRAEYEFLLRHDFKTFAGRCFQDLNPQTDLAMNWHLEVIAAKLTEVREGKIRRLIINLPPRHLKSLMASIAFPAWCLGLDPAAQILCVSYAQDLADKLARDCRGIMTSPWYRKIFPTRLAPHRQAVQEFITTGQGYRLATSTGGVLTGRGADIIVIDDPLKPEEAFSDTQRKTANEWYDHTLYSRLNDKRRGAIVIVMQRLHEDDLVGHVLAQEPWEIVRFPAIAEADEVHEVETILKTRSFTRRRGEALHPDREPLEILDRIRRTIGEYNFAGQYQQSLAPLGGAWSGRNGSSAIAGANGRSASTASCKAGTPPTKRRAQRFLGMHNLGSERQAPLPPRCILQAARISGAQARRAGATAPVRCDGRADRGQGLGHSADPGADRGWLPWCHPLPADHRKDHASARAY